MESSLIHNLLGKSVGKNSTKTLQNILTTEKVHNNGLFRFKNETMETHRKRLTASKSTYLILSTVAI
jgi:hypothetical protein